MKRTKVLSSAPPAYPTRELLGSPWGQRLALVGMLCLAPLPACDLVNHVDGLMVAPQEDWGAQLPSEGLRTLHFADGAILDYRVGLTMTDGGLARWVGDEEPALLELTDARIEDWGPEGFARGDDLRGLEEDLLQAIANAFAGVEDAEVYGFQDCDLQVDAVTPPGDGGEDTDDPGDTGDTG